MQDPMKLPDVVYLDTAYITQTYETVKGVTVPIKVVKKSNVSGEISGLIFKGGASMEEEKEFPISARKMYEELKDHLNALPQIDLEKQSLSELPELFWTESNLGSGQSSATSMVPLVQDGKPTFSTAYSASCPLLITYPSVLR